MATMGAVVLTVDVFGNRPIAAVTDGDFLNDEGFTVLISLARPATEIFAMDNDQYGVMLTINDVPGSGADVLFRSLPLAKDGAPTVVGVPFLSARAGMTAFADPGAQIFHFTGEVYNLQSDSDLFTVDRQSGAVSFVRDVGLRDAQRIHLVRRRRRADRFAIRAHQRFDGERGRSVSIRSRRPLRLAAAVALQRIGRGG